MISHNRRTFLLGTLALAGCARSSDAKASDATSPAPEHVTIEDFSAAGVSLGRKTVPRVVHGDDEWRKLLPAESYVVTRREGTERPYSGKYNDNHADGLYRCICCDTALFDSRAKFESGTGWPSFWQPISNANVNESPDHALGMMRTAVECRRCDAHLGHVFDDGPDPTGLRYCMNSVALKFVART
ncbi:MAG TPA: peptide-methionine (R)-S-oxide reductase MsrB [Steroidobacteraceae bacterium]